ncbi:MAG TPA: sulfurtransferase TusA family protein, partial [Syntrophales bacterium]
MPVTVDARGLACPQPVILVKKTIEENEEVTVFVDNDTAVENIRRLAAKAACKFSVTENAGTWEITLKRTRAAVQLPEGANAREDEMSSIAVSGKETGPLVVILSDNRMG